MVKTRYIFEDEKQIHFAKWECDLARDIRYGNIILDNLDSNNGHIPGIPTRRIVCLSPEIGFNTTMSWCNLEALRKQFNKIKDKCRCILEIGISFEHEFTSTLLFLKKKKPETVYVGVDIKDRSKINSQSDNVFTIRSDSKNHNTIFSFLEDKRQNEIDFLFIDGWHSINQVLYEWEYTKILSDYGIVGFHDTSIHPGPHLFVKNLDRTKWDVIENACDFPNDYGIGFVCKKNGLVNIYED